MIGLNYLFTMNAGIIVLWLIATQVFTAREELAGTTISVIVALILLGWQTNFLSSLSQVSGYIWIVFIPLYFLIGVIWLIIKWKRYTSISYTRIVAELEESLARNGLSTYKEYGSLSTALKALSLNENKSNHIGVSWSSTLYKVLGRSNLDLPLKASQHKEQLTIWGAWWPFSVFWTFLSDYLVNFWGRVIQYLGSYLDKISQKSLEKL